MRLAACSAGLLLTPSLVDSRIGRGCNDIGLDVVPCVGHIAVDDDDVSVVHVRRAHDALSARAPYAVEFTQMAC